ncbi:MAG: class I SAM-dependent methyltransferase [Elusimicrobiales bacterium]|nr:class I SAM-dependent methyltransferase [Elusimicrobiales bacterium]
MKTIATPAALDALAKLGITLARAQVETLECYAALSAEKNARMNLTAAKSARDIFERHLCDGLCACLALRGRLQNDAPAIADAGAGAGFIGAALKTLLPQAQVYFIESVERKCAFLNWALLRAGFKDAHVLCARLDAHSAPPVLADFVFERAMGKITDAAPLCLSITRPGGRFVAYSRPGQGGAVLPPALAGVVEEEIGYRLPHDPEPRSLIVFRK